MAKTPIHNPNDLAQSPQAPSVLRAPLNHSKPAQTCRVHHNPASKSSTAAPETSHAFAPARSIESGAHSAETSPKQADPSAQCPKLPQKVPPNETAPCPRKKAAGYKPAQIPENRKHP